MIKTPSRIFHDASKYCYNWLKKQPFVKEESLTDWILYNISEHNPNIYYKAFTRNEEAANGADWEWWILTDGYSSVRAYRLLIQAKKLKEGGRDNYSLVTYSNANGFQLDLLIAEAKARRALPLYAYYSCCCPDFDKQCRNINYIADELLEWCDGCVNGCYLTSAFELHKNIFGNPRRKIINQELIDSSFGLSLLDVINNTAALSGFLRGLNSYFNNFIPDSPGEIGIIHLYKNLPAYAKALIERKEENLDWLENQLYQEIGNLAGVVIVDAREKKG